MTNDNCATCGEERPVQLLIKCRVRTELVGGGYNYSTDTLCLHCAGELENYGRIVRVIA